jgi:histone deacetylase 6
VKSSIDEHLSAWYKENSRVFVAADHACWTDHELTRRIHKRRFGTVVRSQDVGLSKMMRVHADDAQDWILQRVRSSESGGDTTEDEEPGDTNS